MGSPMRDIDVRTVLLEHLDSIYSSDPRTRIVQELGILQGAARVDVAVINGQLTAYEIKSATDTLGRLDGQRDAYNRVFDRVTAVVAEAHLQEVERAVPAWWGILTAADAGGDLVLTSAREPGENPDVDPHAVVQMLWRDEVLDVLTEIGRDSGIRSANRQRLWDALIEAVEVAELCGVVRDRLRGRRGWRDDA